MNQFKLIFVTFLLLSVTYSQAQQIKGSVFDSYKQPLNGAYVYNTTSKSHAHTSENGYFLIEESAVGDSLEIGLLGFNKTTIILTQKSFSNPLSLGN